MLHVVQKPTYSIFATNLQILLLVQAVVETNWSCQVIAQNTYSDITVMTVISPQ